MALPRAGPSVHSPSPRRSSTAGQLAAQSPGRFYRSLPTGLRPAVPQATSITSSLRTCFEAPAAGGCQVQSPSISRGCAARDAHTGSSGGGGSSTPGAALASMEGKAVASASGLPRPPLGPVTPPNLQHSNPQRQLDWDRPGAVRRVDTAAMSAAGTPCSGGSRPDPAGRQRGGAQDPEATGSPSLLLAGHWERDDVASQRGEAVSQLLGLPPLQALAREQTSGLEVGFVCTLRCAVHGRPGRQGLARMRQVQQREPPAGRGRFQDSVHMCACIVWALQGLKTPCSRQAEHATGPGRQRERALSHAAAALSFAALRCGSLG
jgi:hypothetical protein